MVDDEKYITDNEDDEGLRTAKNSNQYKSQVVTDANPGVSIILEENSRALNANSSLRHQTQMTGAFIGASSHNVSPIPPNESRNESTEEMKVIEADIPAPLDHDGMP